MSSTLLLVAGILHFGPQIHGCVPGSNGRADPERRRRSTLDSRIARTLRCPDGPASSAPSLTSGGSTFRNPAPRKPPIASAGTPRLAVETTAQLFLGVRIQCTSTAGQSPVRAAGLKDDYYGFAAFFSQTGRKKAGLPDDEVVYATGSGDVRQPANRHHDEAQGTRRIGLRRPQGQRTRSRHGRLVVEPGQSASSPRAW